MQEEHCHPQPGLGHLYQLECWHSLRIERKASLCDSIVLAIVDLVINDWVLIVDKQVKLSQLPEFFKGLGKSAEGFRHL